jgi:hypothetical protein
MQAYRAAGAAGLLSAIWTALFFSAFAVDISVDPGTRYQRMEGFGVLGKLTPWKVRQGAFLVDVDLDSVGIYDSLVSELGATLFRTDLEGYFQPDSGVRVGWPIGREVRCLLT